MSASVPIREIRGFDLRFAQAAARLDVEQP